MTLGERIDIFSELGNILDDSISGNPSSSGGSEISTLIEKQHISNKWFTTENINLAVSSVRQMLQKERLEEWIGKYDSVHNPSEPKTIAVIMAGNIPLVGFHDFLSVLISGNRILAKTSHKDSELIEAIASLLIEINPGFRKLIAFTKSNFSDYDAVIASGSDNTARYFEYYFANKPHIFRKNRNSIAIINKETSSEDLTNLGLDIFSYFGLGCRNVSKIFIEKGIEAESISGNWDNWNYIINHLPYANNYLYNKSILQINKQGYKDLGFAIMKEDNGLVPASPVSVIHYEYYTNREILDLAIQKQQSKIQCIVSDRDIRFGKTQFPELHQYADNTDTLKFIWSL